MTHPLVSQLASPDPGDRRAACLAAADDPAGALLAEALGETLADPSKAVARAASDALVRIAERSGPIDAVLHRALHGSRPHARWRAAFTAARLGPPSPRLLPALVEGLASGDGDVRWASARIIVEAGRLHAEVLPLLVGLVRSGEHPVVRRMSAYALRALAPDRPEAALVLLEATADTDLHVRRASLTAMASLVAPPAPVSERLLEVLTTDPDAASRRLAAIALGELGAADPTAIPSETPDRLREAGGDAPDPDLRRAIDRALARLAAGSAEREA